MRKANCNIEAVRQTVLQLKGKSVQVRINPGRNKISIKRAQVEDVYSSLFTIKSEEGKIESYSFSDVLCGRISFLEGGVPCTARI